MILRRVIAHVKAQNWFAVAIDFVILVLGVFIGIQAANWNTMRQAAAEESRLVARLANEFDVALGRARDVENETYQYTVSLDTLLTKLDSGQPMTQEEARALAAAAFSSRVMASIPPSYTEIISSGRTDLLTDPDLKQALRQADSEVRLATQASERLYAAAVPQLTVLQRYVRFDRSPQPGEIDWRPSIKAVDIEGLRRDPLAIAALDRIFYSQTNVQSLAHRATISMESVAAALDGQER